MSATASPRARTNGLVVEALADETLLYDSARHRAHSLRPLAAAVWSLCDGTRSPAELAGSAAVRALQADRTMVEAALDGLARAGLITGWTPSVSRRDVLKRAALVAGVTTILTTRPAHAY